MSSLIIDPVKEIFKDLLKSTCQLFVFESKSSNTPDSHGCCLLLEYNGNHFCLSNAHVLADGFGEKAQFLVGNGKFSTVGGHIYSSSIPISQHRPDDKYDIAIVRLNDETVIHFKNGGYKFLTIGNIKTGHLLGNRDEVLVAAYPATKTKINLKKKEIKPFPFFLRTHLQLRDLSKENYLNDNHFFAAYPRGKLRNSAINGKATGPIPHGISGSGLWLLAINEDGLYRAYLIGILSEYIENKALLVSTKIDLFIEILRQKVDHSIPNHGVKARFSENPEQRNAG